MYKKTINSFWVGGHSEYTKELKKEEESRLAPLREKLKNGKSSEIIHDLTEQIKGIKQKYKIKIEESKQSEIITAISNLIDKLSK